MEDADLRVDGNAIAGLLGEVFAAELSGARVRCHGCGSIAELGAEPAYTQAPGAVVRCRDCDGVMMVVVKGGGRTWLGLTGTTWIELRDDVQLH